MTDLVNTFSNPLDNFFINNKTNFKSNLKVLLAAVKRSDLNCLKEGLSAYPKETVNAPIDGEVLLSAAIKAGSVPMVQYLLQSGANLDTPDDQRLTPLDYASLSHHSNEILPTVISEWISRDKAQISKYLNDPSLMARAANAYHQIKKNPLDLEKTGLSEIYKRFDNNQHTVKKIDLEQVEEFATSSLDAQGNTLLHYLAQEKDNKPQEILAHILKLGINPNTPNHLGQTPLHVACAHQSTLNISTLAEHQGNFFHLDNQQIPPVSLLSIDSLEKDPLKLSHTDVSIAAFVVLNQLTHLFLNAETSKYVVAGFATIPELVNYGLILSEVVLLAQKHGAKRAANSAILRLGFIFLIKYMITNSGKDGMLAAFHNVLPILSVIALPAVASTAFRGLKSAWKNKGWQPLRALRNTIVHSINFSHSTYEIAKCVNNLATFAWHFTLTFEAADLKRQDIKLEKQHSQFEEQIEQQEKFIKTSHCDETTNPETQEYCAFLENEKMTFEKELKNIENAQKFLSQKFINLSEKFSNTFFESSWNQLSSMVFGSPIDNAMKTLTIDPANYSEETIKTAYKNFSKEWHPDKCMNFKKLSKEDCQAMFIKGEKAKELLLNELNKI